MQSKRLNSPRNFVVFTLVCILLAVAVVADPPAFKELPNFHPVNETLYRGGQPKKEGFKRLAELGVKTVVNLRGSDESTREEETLVRAAGMDYVGVPMSSLSRPTAAQIEQVLQIINQAERQPVFIHCKRGADRTGTVIAVYRILHDGWTAKRAQAEADKYGMRWWEFGMKDYLRDLEKRQAKAAAAPAGN